MLAHRSARLPFAVIMEQTSPQQAPSLEPSAAPAARGLPYFGCIRGLRRNPMEFFRRVAVSVGGLARVPLQAGRGNTIVGPYSVRPLAGAPASCPLRWDEVTPRLEPARFTIRTIPERFRAMEDPMTPVLGDGVDMAAAIAAIQKELKG